ILWTTDREGNLDFLSRAGLEFTGIDEEDELMGDRWLSAIHPDDVARTVELWTECVKTGKSYDNEWRLRSADGEYKWFLNRAVLVPGLEAGVDKWVGSCILVDEQKRLASRLSDTLESINDAFLSLDTDWRFRYVNRHAEKMLFR